MTLPDPVILAEGLGRRFAKRAQEHRSYALRDLIRDVLGRNRDQQVMREDEFWAVRDVSFRVDAGDAVGIIGRNGAGKSTLLKMVAGLLKPDTGRAKVRGHVQSLISLGTGFANELSGRENVLNSAAVQGMPRRIIASKFDDIVDFAELEDFIDSPVGTYSSDMRARLGFAVACHLDPQVLLIDEILGVGDIGFQNKCQVRLRQMQAAGVTFLLVSHSPSSVVQICSTALWLHEGRTRGIGPAKDVVESYVKFLDELESQRRIRTDAKRVKQSRVRQKSEIEQSIYGFKMNAPTEISHFECKLMSESGEVCHEINMHDAICLQLEFTITHIPRALKVGIVFYQEDGTRISVLTTGEHDLQNKLSGRHISLRINIPDFNLRPGRYVVMTPIQDAKSYLWRNEAARIKVRGDRTPSLGHMHLTNTMTASARNDP